MHFQKFPSPEKQNKKKSYLLQVVMRKRCAAADERRRVEVLVKKKTPPPITFWRLYEKYNSCLQKKINKNISDTVSDKQYPRRRLWSSGTQSLLLLRRRRLRSTSLARALCKVRGAFVSLTLHIRTTRIRPRHELSCLIC